MLLKGSELLNKAWFLRGKKNAAKTVDLFHFSVISEFQNIETLNKKSVKYILSSRPI